MNLVRINLNFARAILAKATAYRAYSNRLKWKFRTWKSITVRKILVPWL